MTELLLLASLAIGGSTDIVIPESGPAIVTRSVKGACAAPSRGTSARSVTPAEVPAELQRLAGCKVALAIFNAEGAGAPTLLRGLGAAASATDDRRLVLVGIAEKRASVEAATKAVGALPAAPLHLTAAQDKGLQDALGAMLVGYTGERNYVAVFGPKGELVVQALGEDSALVARAAEGLNRQFSKESPTNRPEAPAIIEGGMPPQ